MGLRKKDLLEEGDCVAVPKSYREANVGIIQRIEGNSVIIKFMDGYLLRVQPSATDVRQSSPLTALATAAH